MRVRQRYQSPIIKYFTVRMYITYNFINVYFNGKCTYLFYRNERTQLCHCYHGWFPFVKWTVTTWIRLAIDLLRFHARFILWFLLTNDYIKRKRIHSGGHENVKNKVNRRNFAVIYRIVWLIISLELESIS